MTAGTLLPQGDLEGKRYRGYAQSVAELRAEGGIGALWKGAPWRLFRQLCAVFLFDKIASEVSPILFPHAFEETASWTSEGY